MPVDERGQLGVHDALIGWAEVANQMRERAEAAEARVSELEAAIEEWWKWCSRNGWGAGDAALYNVLRRTQAEEKGDGAK